MWHLSREIAGNSSHLVALGIPFASCVPFQASDGGVDQESALSYPFRRRQSRVMGKHLEYPWQWARERIVVGGWCLLYHSVVRRQTPVLVVAAANDSVTVKVTSTPVLARLLNRFIFIWYVTVSSSSKPPTSGEEKGLEMVLTEKYHFQRDVLFSAT